MILLALTRTRELGSALVAHRFLHRRIIPDVIIPDGLGIADGVFKTLTNTPEWLNSQLLFILSLFIAGRLPGWSGSRHAEYDVLAANVIGIIRNQE